MGKKGTLGTIANFMSQQSKRQLEREKATHRLDLFSIRPDARQPRHLLPLELAKPFFALQMSPQAVIQAWAAQEGEGFSELQKLAASIAQHGLINPISVRPVQASDTVPTGVEYLVVTGERRWWAHVLLASEQRMIHEGKESKRATQIKVSYVAEGVSIRAHQLIENLVREDLNALEKALGIWALRYELSGKDEKVDLSSPPKDLVLWSQVEDALGVSKRYRIYLMAVLQLDPEAQQIVAQLNLSESVIRPITQKLRDYPSLQIEALQQLASWHQEDDNSRAMTRSVKELVESLLNSSLRQKTPVTASVEDPPQGKVEKKGILEQANEAVLAEAPPRAEADEAILAGASPRAEADEPRPIKERTLPETGKQEKKTLSPPQLATTTKLQAHTEELLVLLNDTPGEVLMSVEGLFELRDRLVSLLPLRGT